MFLNLEQLKDVGYFDSNFFIYLEEIDLCKRVKEKNKKIYLDKNIKINHLGVNLTMSQLISRWSFQEIGIGCGQLFIITKNILDI